MIQFNLNFQKPIDQIYSEGFLPQRNQKNLWYFDSSCRSNLSKFSLSSENRRILKKTEIFRHSGLPRIDFQSSPSILKTCHQWASVLNWDFPINSIKNVFTNHIFNFFYQWFDQSNRPIAYSVCYSSNTISHIAYVFYDPQYSHQDLPIRLTLQTIIDSQQRNLKYCYLGRFDPTSRLGFYKRTLPGFEYFANNDWIKYNK